MIGLGLACCRPTVRESRTTHPPRRAALLVCAVLALAVGVPAVGAAAPQLPARRTAAQATALALANPKIASWLERYPPKPTTAAEFDDKARVWEVKVWSGEAGEIALAKVEDRSGVVREAWTGPQVAWKMARGRPGAFGGRTLTSWPVWLGFSAVFFLGLANLRRWRSLRNLDLLVLLSFGGSLAFFNRGSVFTSAALAVPPLVYLLLRMLCLGFGWRPLGERSAPAVRPTWPVWVLLAATLFLVGLRVGLNVQTQRSVIDVGYAGVIGGDRILHGQAPYGHMPQAGSLKPCGPADANGDVRLRIQANGHCEASNPRGDTYGPVAYVVYVPAVAAFGWSGKWDGLPAAHLTSIALDLFVLLALALVGRRFGGPRLGATLAFAWAAYPFTAYVLLANTNDALMPALLVVGLFFAASPGARGASLALAGWTKFASLLLVPLWLTYPGLARPVHRAHARRSFAIAFVAATALAFSILLLEPDLSDALTTFWDRTIAFQIDRDSPFSIWDWGQYHAKGIPDLALAQRAVQALTLVLAGVVAFLPARKGPLELAALSAAVLLAVELSLTHWFYLYLPWVLPFVLLALFLPRAQPART
jgi:hypothetical protein